MPFKQLRVRLTAMLWCWLIAGILLTGAGWFDSAMAVVGGDTLWFILMPVACMAWLHYDRLLQVLVSFIRSRPRRHRGMALRRV